VQTSLSVYFHRLLSLEFLPLGSWNLSLLILYSNLKLDEVEKEKT
jgi:hypothetical protein